MTLFTFHINKEASNECDALVIDIHASLSSLNMSQLKKLVQTPQDELALSFLIQEEKKYQKKRTGRPVNEAVHSFRQLHISHAQAVQALKYMAGTGKLYFNDKAIVCDFYSQNEYYYQLEKEKGSIKISARVKTSLEEFDISESDFIGCGPPHFIIKGYSLKLISTDVSWNKIRKLLKKELQPEDLLDASEDPTAPKIVFVGEETAIRQLLPEPLPVLLLKDRTGAFADLQMNYEKHGEVSYHTTEYRESFKRNSESEKNWEKDFLETNFIKKAVGTSHYYCPVDKVAKSLAFLLELGWKIRDHKGQQVVLFQSAHLAMQSTPSSVIINGKIKFCDYEADLSSLKGSFNRKEHFVQLSPGTVGLLPQSWEEMGLSPLLEEGEVVSEGIRLRRSQIGILSDIWEKQPHLSLDEPLKEMKERLQTFQGISHSPPSEAFKGMLRPYQQEGVDWLSFLHEFGFHGILADDMGLGKTIQVLAFLSRLKPMAPILVVVPTSLIFNWRNEIRQFLPSMKITIHHGPDRLSSLQEIEAGEIILTSYTLLRLEYSLFRQLNYHCIILDEAQVIKNPQSQISQTVCQLQAQLRLSLTGTPIENNLNELWSHFRFLMPDLLGEQKNFESELTSGASDFRYLHRIKRKIRPFILQRKKEAVAKDLPEKIEQTVWTEMTQDQRRLYDDFLAGVKGGLLKKIQSEGMAKNRMEVLEAILRLRQICCHPLLVSSLHSDPETADFSSGKQNLLLQDLETLIQEGKKVLVYSQFTGMLKLISKELRERQWKFVYLDGSTTDREKTVDQFQSDPSIPLFLISLKAGGVGLNLTQADYVLLYDPWWNEAAESQAINRAHRIGRKETVIAKRYVTVESIEEKIMALKSHKRSLIGEILNDEWNNAALTAEDLTFLLS